MEISGNFVKLDFHDKDDKSLILGHTQFMPLLSFYEDLSTIFGL